MMTKEHREDDYRLDMETSYSCWEDEARYSAVLEENLIESAKDLIVKITFQQDCDPKTYRQS